MTNVRGMTLQQFNDVIADMRKIYYFKDDTTRLIDLRDEISNTMRSIEIITEDEETGVTIILKKGTELAY